jgi:hypothetical protein
LCDSSAEEPPFLVIWDVGSVVFFVVVVVGRGRRTCFDIVVVFYGCGSAIGFSMSM